METNAMFSYETIQQFNDTEIFIYKYIIKNCDRIPFMTIREMGSELAVSTSTILRFCNKVNCEGYSEFKKRIKQEFAKQELDKIAPEGDLREIMQYFQVANTSAFEQKIRQGAQIIRKAQTVIFVGSGSSGTLARYGARYFSNLGKFSIGLEDPYYPAIGDTDRDTVIVVLSVSGETEEIIRFIKQSQSPRVKVLSVTNQPNCTVARMSDWNISYNMNMLRLEGAYNATTQVPVLFLIEVLARRI